MEMIQQGAIGRVTQIEYQHRVDTRHGAGYFLRWNRERARSGGLSVHKSSHHLDLLQWWAGARPEVVFGRGARHFYGADGAYATTAEQPWREDPYFRAQGDSNALQPGDRERTGCSASPTRWSIRSRSRCGSMTRPSTSRTPTAPSSGTPAASRRPIPSTSPHPGRAPPSASPAPPGGWRCGPGGSRTAARCRMASTPGGCRSSGNRSRSRSRPSPKTVMRRRWTDARRPVSGCDRSHPTTRRVGLVGRGSRCSGRR
ncbi:hypothetical protein CGZ92_10435 [Parenemella sanctibonifatiensis]|uniref:Gfo/Idh/MocA-like oxidoreductase C-terminal domain-containing protein n=1 Tax=Parenemella sanctibonifatiensis TaxID=2016505 RepID=A0A255E373_9ACTN|nr:hypothetical protein CGZ92_10435 [Parenemella sanctibonifatiensis]